jgi:hypothetical protein
MAATTATTPNTRQIQPPAKHTREPIRDDAKLDQDRWPMSGPAAAFFFNRRTMKRM